jgi:hypothetical protein
VQQPMFRFLQRRPRLALALLPLLSLGAAHADTWLPLRQEYLGLPGDRLGSSIAVGVGVDAQGHAVVNRVYVGAPYSTDGTFAECGSVQVYVPGAGGWAFSENLFATTRQAGAHFGASVASDVGHVLVGAPDYTLSGGANAGYAEFFSDNGADAPALVSVRSIVGTGGNFGSAVAIDSDMAAVARPGPVGGCVDTYHLTNAQDWVAFPAQNEACDAHAGDEMGTSVAILRTSASSFVLVAGAPGEPQNGNALAGGAHVFIPNPNIQAGGFVEVGMLAADSPTVFDFFGSSVGIDDQYIYVGATGRDNGAGRVGSVTIFAPASLIGYDNLAEYFPGAPATIGGQCGTALSVDAARAQFIVGCRNSTGTLAGEGTARVFQRFTFLGSPVWLESVLSFGNQTHGADALGSSVALFDEQAFAGAPNAHTPTSSGNGGWKAFVPDEIFGNGFDP